MAKLVVNSATDMTAWDNQFIDVTGASLTKHTASQFLAEGSTHDFGFTGSGLQYTKDHHEFTPSGGIVHSLTVTHGATTDFTLTGFNLGATSPAIVHLFGPSDWNGFEAAVFATADTLIGSKGNDHLLGFGGGDTFDLSKGGNDTAEGGNDDDTFLMGGALTADDEIVGGAGSDTVVLDGTYTHVDFAATTLSGVETIRVAKGHDVSFDFAGESIPDTGLTIDARQVGAGNRVQISPIASTLQQITFQGGHGGDYARGGNGADLFYGNDGDDTLYASGGSDDLIGGKGHDVFIYAFAGDSTGVDYDRISDFNAAQDAIGLETLPTGVDDEILGSLSDSSFNKDVENWVDKHALAKNHAALFAPGHGDHAGEVFLVVDFNGKAGYQAGKDLLVSLTDGADAHGLHLDNFVRVD